MKNLYTTPLVEVVEIEIEDVVMVGNSGSGVEDMANGETLGDNLFEH